MSPSKPLTGLAPALGLRARSDVSGLGGLDVPIADLGGAALGLASGNTIWLDVNAAGWGWFLDQTPADDAEFTASGNQGERVRIDLLPVLMHEVGHLLGHEHDDDWLMGESLAPGERWTPGDVTTGDPRSVPRPAGRTGRCLPGSVTRRHKQ